MIQRPSQPLAPDAIRPLVGENEPQIISDPAPPGKTPGLPRHVTEVADQIAAGWGLAVYGPLSRPGDVDREAGLDGEARPVEVALKVPPLDPLPSPCRSAMTAIDPTKFGLSSGPHRSGFAR